MSIEILDDKLINGGQHTNFQRCFYCFLNYKML